MLSAKGISKKEVINILDLKVKEKHKEEIFKILKSPLMGIYGILQKGHKWFNKRHLIGKRKYVCGMTK